MPSKSEFPQATIFGCLFPLQSGFIAKTPRVWVCDRLPENSRHKKVYQKASRTCLGFHGPTRRSVTSSRFYRNKIGPYQSSRIQCVYVCVCVCVCMCVCVCDKYGETGIAECPPFHIRRSRKRPNGKRRPSLD